MCGCFCTAFAIPATSARSSVPRTRWPRSRIGWPAVADIQAKIDDLRSEAEAAIAGASSVEALEELRVRYLGRKAELTQILRGIGELAPEERGPVGQAANTARQALEALLERRRSELEADQLERGLAAEAIDVTLPGSPAVPVGSPNLLIRTQRETEDIFCGLGYRVMEGPEVELDYCH